MKKLYAVTNKGTSDFGINEDFVKYEPESVYNPEGELHHDAGIVILAESIEEAYKLMGGKHKGTLTQVPVGESGVVLFCDGEC